MVAPEGNSGITELGRVHHLRTMNVCAKFCTNAGISHDKLKKFEPFWWPWWKSRVRFILRGLLLPVPNFMVIHLIVTEIFQSVTARPNQLTYNAIPKALPVK